MVDIYEKLTELRKQGKDVVIVTVTEKEGMGPADVGKKMLVSEDNVAFGTVGGGAIEFYAREKCKEVLKSRQSFTEKYYLIDREVCRLRIHIRRVRQAHIKQRSNGGRLFIPLFYQVLRSRDWLLLLRLPLLFSRTDALDHARSDRGRGRSEFVCDVWE